MKSYDNIADVDLASWQDLIELQKEHLMQLEADSLKLIKENTEKFNTYTSIIPVSMGKDSMLTCHLVRKLYPETKSIFNNTSLDCADTYRMVKTFPNCEIMNPDFGFYQDVEINHMFPTRFARFCCRIYKVGVIVSQLDHNHPYLMWMGMRNEESNTRSGYQDEWVNEQEWGKTCWQSLSKCRIENKQVNNGLNGKSGIFFKAAECLRVIQPKYFMFENVIPSSDKDLQTMTEYIGVKPVLIDSGIFSVQNRERYYWTNIPLSNLPKESPLVLKDIMENNVDEKYFYDKDFEILDMNKRVCAELKVNNIEMNRRIYNPNFKCRTLTCINGGYHHKKVLDNGRPRKLTEVEYERLQGLPDNFTNVEIMGRK